MSVEVAHQPATASIPLDQILHPPPYPAQQFAFADFLRREFDFSLEPSRPICRSFDNGGCRLGANCPDRHPQQPNHINLICKHWLRGLCKKGDSCEFLHEYNLRLMPECTQFAQYGVCANGSDCLYLHIEAETKRPACPHYERGFCPLGPHCAARHIKKKTFCPYYLAGFCPNGRQCAVGGHPVWREKDNMPKPEVKIILSKEEIEAEQQRKQEKFDKMREEEERDREERGLPQRRDNFRGRGRGRGRGQWQDRQDGSDRQQRRGNRY